MTLRGRGGRLRRLVPEGYARCLADRDFRRMQPGFLISFIGDGMSLLGVAWLAIRLAAPADRATVTGLAVAAYSLPGAIGSIALRRRLSSRDARSLILLDSLLRGVVFTLIPVLHWTHLLDATTYIVLLAASSLLHAWGIAGRQAFVAECLPPETRLAGNSVIAGQEQFSYIAGPPLAGAVASVFGPGAVLLCDAASYAFMTLTVLRVRVRSTVGRRPPIPLRRTVRTFAHRPALLGLLALSYVFYLFYGPVEVAVPVFVADHLDGDPTMLGWIWGAFGAGAVTGAVITGALRRLPLWPATLAIVAGWGLAMLPLAVFGTLAAGIAGFALGGLIYAPYGPLSVTLLQREAPPDELVSLSAFRSAILVSATPLGAALGGRLVVGLGSAGTLLLSGLSTLGLAVLGAVCVLLARIGARARTRSEGPQEPRASYDAPGATAVNPE